MKTKPGPKKGQGPVKDLSNQTFGYLTPKKIIGRTKGRDVIWSCQCVCGNFVDRVSRHLKKGYESHCGCMKGVTQRLNNDKKGFNPLAWLFRSYKRMADRRHIPWKLTENEFYHLVKSNCYYCNTEPKPREHAGVRKDTKFNGVDRKNNSKSIGYTSKNCVPCCGVCNRMKWILSHDDFIVQATKITTTNDARLIHIAAAPKEE